LRRVDRQLNQFAGALNFDELHLTPFMLAGTEALKHVPSGRVLVMEKLLVTTAFKRFRNQRFQIRPNCGLQQDE